MLSENEVKAAVQQLKLCNIFIFRMAYTIENVWTFVKYDYRTRMEENQTKTVDDTAKRSG